MTNFADFDLIAPLQRALLEEEYVEPTPIQAQTLAAALRGRDILGCAQTGTGKTAAFLLPILNHLASKKQKAVTHRPLSLILAPTRELAIQIGDSCEAYGRHVDVSYALIYGGVGQGRQVQALRRGVHILIATPGRLIDLMDQEHVHLNRLQSFVLDEADRMLDMGFLPDLKRIIKTLPTRRQSLFFSATIPDSIRQLTERLLHNPVQVKVDAEQTNVDLIDQRVIFAGYRQKRPLLRRLLTAGDVGQAIVFMRTKRGANYLAEYLRDNQIDAAAIHGNKSQNARQRTLDSFRSEKLQVLVATDLAARGIDVDGISHIFNYELPTEPESYVHRIGRTGRAGATGIAISFCSPDEVTRLRTIERLIGFEILEDGRQPEPDRQIASSDSQPDEGSKASGNRRRRRRGRRNGTSAETPTETAPSKPRKKKKGKGRRGRRSGA